MNGVPRELLDTWADLWRHPSLLVTLFEHGSVDAETAAQCVVRGVAEPMTAAEGITTLLDDGEFAIVEELLGGDSPAGDALPADLRQELAQQLRLARRNARISAAREQDLLLERARRCDLGLTPFDDLAEHAEFRRRDADALLDKARRRVGDAEEEVRAAQEARLAEIKGDERWAASVRDCIRAGEFATARALLTDHPDDPADSDPVVGGPRAVLRPPPVWEWPSRSLQEIMLWYGEPTRLPFPQLGRYVHGASDPAGRTLVEALRHLCEHLDRASVAGFAKALGAVLGEDLTPRVTPVGGGHLTRLHGLDDARLPRLALLGHDGIALWVAPAGEPPPDAREPVVWFVPEVEPQVAAPPGVALLGASHLFRLLASTTARSHSDDAPTRRINLLRMIVPELTFSSVIGTGGRVAIGTTAPLREAVAWSLDLWGVSADAVALDSLVFETGGHPALIHGTLRRLLADLPNRSTRRITQEDVASARGPEQRRTMRDLLLAPFDEDAPCRAVLGLAYALCADEPFTCAELRSTVYVVEIDADTAAILEPLLDVEASAERLADDGLLRRADGQRYSVLRSGVGDLLCADRDWEPADMAEEALSELYRYAAQARGAIRAALAERVLRRVGHRNDNRVSTISDELRAALTETDPESALVMIQRALGGVQELGGARLLSTYEEVLRPPEVCDLNDLLRQLTRRVERESPGDTSVRYRASAGLAVPVLANPAFLDLAVENLVVNAVQAIGRGPTDASDVLVTLATADRGPLPDPGAWCSVDVEDSGPGLSEEQYRRLADGVRFTTKSAGGDGIRATREVTDELGGVFEVLRRSERLGGAHLRIWLPLHDPAG